MTACNQLTTIGNSPRIHYPGLQNLEVGNHRLSKKLEHVFHSLRYFCSSKHGVSSQGGIKQPWLLCAENEEEMVDGILEPRLPSQSAGVMHLAHQSLNFRRSWPEGKGSEKCLQGWTEEWEKGVGELRGILLELEETTPTTGWRAEKLP